LTDNRNRTAGEVRATFTKSGGNLAETGAVSFMFDHVGVIEYDAKVASAEAMLEAAIEAGADDVVSTRAATRSTRRRNDSAWSPRRWRRNSASRARRARLAAAEYGGGRRRAGREALKLIENSERARRRAERLCQFRGLRRAGEPDERLTFRASLGLPLLTHHHIRHGSSWACPRHALLAASDRTITKAA
jgi:hypothetical protein